VTAVKRLINPNLTHLVKSYRGGKSGAVLEGSSRSGKTFSSLDFIIYISSKVETGSTINIIKETYNSFKTTLYDDFNRRLPDFGIRSPFADKQEVKSFKLFGNKINLLGADSESVYHGVSCDYFYINEALDVTQKVFDQAEMRCRKFWWMDYNPKFTDHWIFDKVCSRPDVATLRTTFKDNPFIAVTEKRKILSYEPTPANIAQGTADDYMWNVYGLGLRAAPEGLIFQHVEWIKEFPKEVEHIYYGSDIGKTISPSTIVKLGIHGDNLFIEKLAYGPTPNPNNYIETIQAVIKAEARDVTIWADSAEPGYISDARRAGLRVLAVNKFAGSITYGISLLKKFKIHIVDCPEWRKEQANYKFREINGIKLDEPIDDFNHLWDAARYAALSNLRHKR
jgi:phage terminase large subunit